MISDYPRLIKSMNLLFCLIIIFITGCQPTEEAEIREGANNYIKNIEKGKEIIEDYRKGKIDKVTFAIEIGKTQGELNHLTSELELQVKDIEDQTFKNQAQDFLDGCLSTNKGFDLVISGRIEDDKELIQKGCGYLSQGSEEMTESGLIEGE